MSAPIAISFAAVLFLIFTPVFGDGKNGLDLLMHSPGGSPDAAEAVVNYLRSKFTDIRVIIPQAAMSAATMLACAANRIVMGKHSSLGPIDPQFFHADDHGNRSWRSVQCYLDAYETFSAALRDNPDEGVDPPSLPVRSARSVCATFAASAFLR